MRKAPKPGTFIAVFNADGDLSMVVSQKRRGAAHVHKGGFTHTLSNVTANEANDLARRKAENMKAQRFNNDWRAQDTQGIY